MSAITMSRWDWVLLIVTIGSAVGVLFLVMIRKFSSHSYEEYEVQSALREVTKKATIPAASCSRVSRAEAGADRPADQGGRSPGPAAR